MKRILYLLFINYLLFSSMLFAKNKPYYNVLEYGIGNERQCKSQDKLSDFLGLPPDGEGKTDQLAQSISKPVKLFIDNKEVIDNNGKHAYVEKEGERYLLKVGDLLEVRYFQDSGGKKLNLVWDSDGSGR